MACIVGAQDFATDAFATASCSAKYSRVLHLSSTTSLFDEECNLDPDSLQSEEATSANVPVMLQIDKQPMRSEFQYIQQVSNTSSEGFFGGPLAEASAEPLAVAPTESPIEALVEVPLGAGMKKIPMQRQPHRQHYHTGRRRRVSNQAFVTMLCVAENSTFDRPDGLGSEIGTLVHGHMINNMSSKAVADNVLLHVTSGSCKKELQMETQLRNTFDRIIEFNGSSRLESVISSSYKTQTHLWMKLLAMNMTEYERVMWLGFDTYPIRSLTLQNFDCESYPCIEPRGNADLMVFEPNAKEMNRIVDELAINYTVWDGIGGYDMTLLRGSYPNMSLMNLTMNGPIEAMEAPMKGGPGMDIVHFAMNMKPWFQAHCRELRPNATLPDADFLGTKLEGKWCKPWLLKTAIYYVFWQVAVEVCKPADPISILLLEEQVHLDALGRQACSSFVTLFPELKPWCH